MPPECFNDGKPYKPKPMDIWAVGVSIYTLMFGKLPFGISRDKNFVEQVKNGQPEIPHESANLKEVLTATLDKNPETRITAMELLYLSWFSVEN